ncbi:MAG: hypothetical protein ACI9IV_002125 [Paracoccaceae bacterium]|jgi:hypothetical protein
MRDVHEPKPCDGRVLHIVTIDSSRGPGLDLTMGWGDLVTGPMDTVYLEELSVEQGRNLGTADAASQIETLLLGLESTGNSRKDQKNAQ